METLIKKTEMVVNPEICKSVDEDMVLARVSHPNTLLLIVPNVTGYLVDNVRQWAEEHIKAAIKQDRANRPPPVKAAKDDGLLRRFVEAVVRCEVGRYCHEFPNQTAGEPLGNYYRRVAKEVLAKINED